MTNISKNLLTIVVSIHHFRTVTDIMLLFYALIISAVPAYSLLGFDCGGQHLNVTSISLLDSGDCNLDIKTTNHTDVYIQLLQISDYNYAEVIQCKVEVMRTILYCGMHSHVSTVKDGYATYLQDISNERCRSMHEDGSANVIFNRITGLKGNFTNIRSLTLAGTVSNDGKCKGTNYNDPYGQWDNVVVQAIIKITLKSGYVPIHINTGKIILKSGTTCTLADGFCIDSDDGYSFWKPIPTYSCDFHQYDVLYEGTAKKIRDDTLGKDPPVVYSLTTQDITFALTITKPIQHCGYTLQRTEHPKLLIVETRKGNEVKTRGDIPVDNLDIFSYVNSKFVYVEKHIRTQMTALYHNVMRQRCELEKEVLHNTLSLATLLPDEFAYRLMKGPGYMAVNAGEAMHVVQCIPVDVIVRRTKECYIELPIFLRNASLFITPKSRIITKIGTQKECSHQLPTLYRIEDTWVQFTPEPHLRQVMPQQLQPLTRISWEYLTPGSLATSGIYTQEDINKLRDHIMFPAEKPALLNSIARGITGYPSGANTASMYNLLDEEALNKIAQSTASKLWGGFVTFGSATAGVLGIFIIIRIIKVIIDTAIHGYALHTVYGCSLHLLGALWSSLTHLLLHLAHGPPSRRDDKDSDRSEKDKELQDIEEHLPAPTAPSTTEPRDITYVNLQPYHSCNFKKLHSQLSELEQIPEISPGVRSKKGGEV